MKLLSDLWRKLREPRAPEVTIRSLAIGAAPPPPPAPPPRPAAVGIVLHELGTDAADAGAMHLMGRRSARISYYGDAIALSDQVRALASVGVTPLIVTYPPLTQGLLLLGGSAATWQLGNEPDPVTTDPGAIGRAFREAYETWTPLGVSVLPPGLPNTAGVAWTKAALAAGLGRAGVLCLHAYGDPLEDAVRDRLAMARAAGWTGRVWFTEIGAPADGNQAAQVTAAVRAAAGAERVYVYALHSEGDVGGPYTLTDSARAAIAAMPA